MAATTMARDTTAEIAFLTRALKAPTLRESVPRLAGRARAESWSHEEFLAACLQREVAARESHGGEGRILAARFPVRPGTAPRSRPPRNGSPASPRRITQASCKTSWSSSAGSRY